MRLIIIPLVALASVLPGAASAEPFPTNTVWDNPDSSYFRAQGGGKYDPEVVCGYSRYRKTRLDCTAFEVNDDFEQVTYTLRRHGRPWRHGVLGNAPIEDLPRLEYGVTYRYHGIKCRESRTRLKCWNRSNHGFYLYGEGGWERF
jgi:hypothetical protein